MVIVIDSCQPMKVPLPSDNVVVRECRCGCDGSALITDVASVLACGNNEHNKLGLNQRQGFLMAMKNMFNKVQCNKCHRDREPADQLLCTSLLATEKP